jgi:hypothetical protein
VTTFASRAKGDIGEDLVARYGEREVEKVAGEDRYIVLLPVPIAEPQDVLRVLLNREQMSATVGERIRENPAPGADLQHDVVRADAGATDEPDSQATIVEKILRVSNPSFANRCHAGLLFRPPTGDEKQQTAARLESRAVVMESC